MIQTSLVLLNVLVIVQLHEKWMYMTIAGKVKGSLGQCFFSASDFIITLHFFCKLINLQVVKS